MTRRALQSRSRSIEVRRPGLRRSITSLLCLAVFLSGCTAQASSGGASSGSDGPGGQSSSITPARQSRPAASQRVMFVPERLTLPGHGSAEVQPAATVDGLLRVPENVRHVGWWDGSSQAGEPFGSTVIAGHVDSATEGIGFFARLLKIKVGDTVTLRGGSHALKYRVTSVRKVAKKALATDSQAFKQTGSHRLVLITCTGNYHRDRGGYDSNLVVVAKPRGLAR